MPVRQRIPSFQENKWTVRLYPSVTDTGHSVRSAMPMRPVMRTREFEIDSALDEVRAEACIPNWNGEGAKPVPEIALKIAKDFLLLLPKSIPLPEIGGDPDGAAELFWSRDGQRLSISVYEDGLLVYAGRINGNHVADSEAFSQSVPYRLSERLRVMFDVKRALRTITSGEWILLD